MQLSEADGGFAIAYFEHRFPVAPDSYPLLLEDCRERLEEELGRRNECVQELASIITEIRHLPPRRPLNPSELDE